MHKPKDTDTVEYNTVMRTITTQNQWIRLMKKIPSTWFDPIYIKFKNKTGI